MLNKSYIFYSSLKEEIDFKKNILIIDSIGILSKIYKYGSLCYVGGGMGKDGLHNILEPSIFGLPIICLLYTSPSPRDGLLSRMPSSA